MNLDTLLQDYRAVLLDDIIPWWMRHAVEPGGCINNCIEDDGKVINRDRWSWSQWRAVWVFSALYNRIEQRSEWLDVGTNICRFLTTHGTLPNGHWPLLLGEDGTVKMGYESIYADGFALYGLVELWRATKDDLLIEAAMSTFRATEQALNADTPPPAYPYPIPEGRMPHGVSMMFSLAYGELAQVTGDPAVQAAADLHHHRVMDTFLRPDRGLVLEWLNTDGTEAPPPEGTAVNPGHAIESMWFQIHIAQTRGDTTTVDRAIAAVKRHLEIGWDAEYDGLFLAVDADGAEEIGWKFADTKLWWPHTEALYASLLAYEHSQDPAILEWHDRIHDYTFTHFPNKDHGEWHQKLDRHGQPITEVVALPVKDPFHLPRALIYCIDVLGRLTPQG
jgi:N-acylglucosamine 2-epimerase